MSKTEHFLVLTLFACVYGLEHSASFYGESYIHVPMQDASSTTQVLLYFKTHRPHGLLLLAAGSTDYLLLEIKSGMVKIRINLGSGEASVYSSPAVRLDDHLWHKVEVTRRTGTLELIVDGIRQGSVETPGSFHELNIESGIYLGGTGAFFTNSLNTNLKEYRGCMKDVIYNENNILQAARELKSVKNAFEIAWDCDSEFSAGTDAPVSFLSDTSFVAFSHFHAREKGVFVCDFKTRSPNAVILFNSGQGSYKDDFMSLEIIDGQPKLSVNSGSGILEVVLVHEVSDGKWHELDLSISQSTVELRVDNVRNTTRFGGENSYLNLAGHLFVGGVGLKARAHALHLGLQSLQGDRSLKGSMLGCMRHIVINSRPYGFREVQISRHVDSFCTWSFPCALQPCIEEAECSESRDGDSFQCTCDQPVCTKDEPDKTNVVSDADIQELIAVQPLRVQEDGVAVINTNTIDVIFDYRSYHIREIAIRFQVVLPPRFGRFEVDTGHWQAEYFTLFDLLNGKVTYTHDGTDSETDDATIELSINSDLELPKKMQGNFEFVLPIKITLHNDPPKIHLPVGNIISISADSKLQITAGILDVRDSDTKNTDIHYQVTFLRPGKSHFENYSTPNEPISTFSHQDVTDGSVWFAHVDDAVVDVKFNVSDDSLQSDVTHLRFQVVPLELKVLHNTGIMVAYSTNGLVTEENLTTTTNVPLENLEVRYRITKLPNFGQIQRLQHGSEDWTDVDTFTQRHLNKSRIRYVHFSNDFSVSSDEFSFIVTAKDAITDPHTFIISFVPVTLSVKNNIKLVIHQVPFAPLRNNSLLVTSSSGQIDTTRLTFTIYRTPKQGAFFFFRNHHIVNPLDFDGLKSLENGGNFSQADVDSGSLYFKFHKPAFDRLDDFVDLTVRYPSSTGMMVRFWVEYVPLDTAVRFTNNGLKEVEEGGKKGIEKSNLYLEMDGYKDFQFSLIRPPQHGNVTLVDPHTLAPVESRVVRFTTSDIRKGMVVYEHDDSETDQDYFMFSAVPLFDSEAEMPEEIQEFSGTFHISIIMQNDNPPERLVNKVFQVVSNSQRKITLSDLSFTDNDIDYDDSNLQYRRQTIPNGEILRLGTNAPVYQFTQKDIEEETLIFQHKGASFGQATISVTDGQFYWTGVFEIKASDPYISLENNTGLHVQKGGKHVITSANLSIASNIDELPRNFNFLMTEEPLHGNLLKEGKDVEEFTYEDILNGLVEYLHDGSNSMEDKFQFAFVHGDVQNHGTFAIIIEDERMQHPPEVIHNRMLSVLEGGAGTITKSYLLLQHPALSPSEITFIIISPPKHGTLHVAGVTRGANEPLQFTQEDINGGGVEYRQMEKGATSDRFTFDVDSDSQALRNMEFSIEVVPISLPVQAGNLTVAEGGVVVLTKETLKTTSNQYQSENIVYEIIVTPAHGFIRNSDNLKSYNLPFSSGSMLAGKVNYHHDGSESLTDTFTVVASQEDGSLRSQPVSVTVYVTPLDDQAPRIVVNKGLSVWADSVTLLTSEHLHADDPDTSSTNIIFKVSSPSNGHLAYLNNTFHKITEFSQHDVDAGRIVFVHKGESHGEFSFHATDGTNDDVQRKFRIRAHPVVLELLRSGPLMIFPNTIHPVSNDTLLAATTSANFSKPIVFTIMEPKPMKGKIVTMLEGRPLEIKSFTQEEVNSGRIFYQHTDYMQHWRQTDVIALEISTAYATPLKEVCNIDISFGNINTENQDMLLGLYKVSVSEGGSVSITNTHLNSNELLQRLQNFQEDTAMTLEILLTPQHGKLYLDGAVISAPTLFTQDDVDEEKLIFKHDNSDTLQDTFAFSVEIRPSGNILGNVPLQKHVVNFTIEVLPVNDEKFQLVTQNPSLQVLQGMQTQVTQENLLTVDPDTPPSDIVYTVLSQPTNGRLVFASSPNDEVDSFTQQDINDGLLIFSHNGSAKNGDLYFKVWDGHFPAIYKKLHIFYTPLEIDFSKVRQIELLQSESSVFISGKYLNVSSNGNRRGLKYNVTKMPRFGTLVQNGKEIEKFTQEDVDRETVLYTMDNLSSSDDSFTCNIYLENTDVGLSDQEIKIIVKPLIKQSSLIAPAGATVAITKNCLDATELATRTGDNPIFHIVDSPKHGQILRKLRKKRELIAQPVLKPVEEFTFEDVLYAKVFYVSNVSSENGPLVADSFTYILRAHNVQPARGRFLINLDDSEEESDSNATDDIGDKKESLGKSNVGGAHADEDESNDFMIVGIVLGILFVLAIIFAFLIFLWRRQQRQNEYQYQQNPSHQVRTKPRPYISGPLHLEQPHVHIEPQDTLNFGEGEDEEEHQLMRHLSNLSSVPMINVTHESIEAPHTDSSPLVSSPPPRSPDLSRAEVSSAIPDCKVTPMIEAKGEKSEPFSDTRSGPGMASDRQSGQSSNSTDLFDWTLMDPELLEHCRTEMPILRDSQYWV